MSDLVKAIVIVFIAFALCSTASVVTEGEQPTCTMTKLTNSSHIICKYKDKVLFNGEIKNE